MLVKAGASPFDRDTPEGREARLRIRRVVGPELFFDRRKPEAATVAPPYRVPRLPSG